ncbi:MAG: hypothetical protein Q8934_10300 [Bacillota bacterium]|nr:hypothetical protein [Bacillota bacterium]
MIKPIFSDEEFQDLNSIDLSKKQKITIWRNLNLKIKRRRKVSYLKNSLILLSTLLIVFILSTNLLNRNLNKHRQSAAIQKNKMVTAKEKQSAILKNPEQILKKSDSEHWELIERQRYDLAIIEKINTNANQISIVVTREKSFGGDADPYGPVFNPDSKTREYRLKTSDEKQTLYLKGKMKVLLAVGHYANGQDQFYAAEVLSYKDSNEKFYNPQGQLANFRLSSAVKMVNGELETTDQQIKEKPDNLNLNNLTMIIPTNWTKRGNENEIFFDDKSKQTVGGISIVGYYGDFSAALPNHSQILKTDNVEVSFGKGKIFTLLRDNPAASNNSKTWNEIHAILPINKNNLALDVWVQGNKDILLSILKSIHLK